MADLEARLASCGPVCQRPVKKALVERREPRTVHLTTKARSIGVRAI